jgi:3-oxoacyl-[acyl-carrier protein] reductase
MLLKNRIALITGAARGIGAACADTFLKYGAEKVILVDIDASMGSSTLKRIDGSSRGRFIQADIAREEEVTRVFDIVSQEYSCLDILLNVAGICSTRTIFDETMEGWERMMNINLKGAFLFMRQAFQHMQKNRYGRIVNMSSISGQVGGIRTSPAYAASKAGMLSLTKSFAKLGAKENITVNAIAPGLIDTDMTNAADFHYSLEEVPMGRLGLPEDVAHAALFLASDLAGYITGQCINVNGGMYM